MQCVTFELLSPAPNQNSLQRFISYQPNQLLDSTGPADQWSRMAKSPTFTNCTSPVCIMVRFVSFPRSLCWMPGYINVQFKWSSWNSKCHNSNHFFFNNCLFFPNLNMKINTLKILLSMKGWFFTINKDKLLKKKTSALSQGNIWTCISGLRDISD